MICHWYIIKLLLRLLLSKTIRKILLHLKKQYSNYFTEEHYKKADYYEHCLLINLALIDLPNEIKNIITENLHLMNERQLDEFKDNDFQGFVKYFPLYKSLQHGSLAIVTNYYNEKGDILYVKSNDNILKIIKDQYCSLITDIFKKVNFC